MSGSRITDRLNPEAGSFTFTFWANLDPTTGDQRHDQLGPRGGQERCGQSRILRRSGPEPGRLPRKPDSSSCWETPPGPEWTRPLPGAAWVNGSLWPPFWTGRKTCTRSPWMAGRLGRRPSLRSGQITPIQDLGIGWDIGVNNFWFHGTIDEVRLYNYALSDLRGRLARRRPVDGGTSMGYPSPVRVSCMQVTVAQGA